MRQELGQLLIGDGVERENIAPAGAALVVGRIEQGRAQPRAGRRHGIAGIRRDRPRDGQDLVTLDQFRGALDRGLGIGLVVLVKDLDRLAQDAAGLVDLLDRKVETELGLITE